MDSRYLESLIAVVEYGSIARAAAVQHLTSAAVGQRIQALERELAVTLLNRESHRARPTEACLNILPRARKILVETQRLATDADRSGLSGRFQLGSISTALTGLLPGVIKMMAAEAPNLSLQIKPGTSKELISELAEGRLDAAIMILPPHSLPPSLRTTVIRREQLLLLSNNAAGRNVTQKLTSNPYIAYDPNSWGGARAKQFLVDKGLHLEAFCELDGLEGIVKLVQQGMGVSLVPAWAGLDVKAMELDSHAIKNSRYLREVALVYPKNPVRPQLMKMLSTALD